MNLFKNHTLSLLLLATVAVALPACKKKEGCTDTNALNYDADADKDCCCEYAQPPASNVVQITSNITTNTIWTNTNRYLLVGFIYVANGATLTIQEGTVIKGDKPTKGSLIVQRGAKLIADGQANAPIVFTSNQETGFRERGDWGGIILCGRAPHNQPGDQVVEGGPDAYYGGSDPDDNSGTLRYVRIEYAGIAFQPGQEINGLTLASVGRNTIIDHVQVSYSGDDSFEWFGGTVNAKHLIAHRGLDDDFDQDFGWQGKVQYALALRDPNAADGSGSNGFECDNDASGNPAAPYSQGTWSNVTILGPLAVSSTIAGQYKRALHLRRNTRTRIHNSVFAGYATGLLIDGSTTEANAANNDLQFRNSVLAGISTAPLDVMSGSSWDITSWFNTTGWNNGIISNMADLGITLPVTLTSPTLRPNTGSPLLGGAEFSGAVADPFFDAVSFRGAFGTSDWTSGWANWDPQNTPY